METVLNQIVTYILNDLVIPICFIIITFLCTQIRTKINEWIQKKTEQSNEELKSILTTNALTQIDRILESVVAKNQSVAEAYKAANEDGKLTAEEIDVLRKMARDAFIELAPSSITSDDVITMLGGDEVIEKLIDAGIEKALANLKNCKSSC